LADAWRVIVEGWEADGDLYSDCFPSNELTKTLEFSSFEGHRVASVIIDSANSGDPEDCDTFTLQSIFLEGDSQSIIFTFIAGISSPFSNIAGAYIDGITEHFTLNLPLIFLLIGGLFALWLIVKIIKSAIRLDSMDARLADSMREREYKDALRENKRVMKESKRISSKM